MTGLSKFGAERQTSEIARLLSDRHEVVLVGYKLRGSPIVVEDWIQPKPHIVEAEPVFLKDLVLSPVSIAHKLRHLDPDVCIQRAVGSLTGYVGMYCRLHNARFIYHSASNWDSSSRGAFWVVPSPFSLFYYSLGLSLADIIVAQTNDIANQFRKRFRGMKKLTVVPQIYDAKSVCPSQRKPSFVLWLARLVWYKNPNLFIRLARRLPTLRFVMAGSGPLEEAVRTAVKGVRNLEFLGAVRHDHAEQLCAEASLFVNTSVCEGFPNTLLESGARETPYVSLFYDPDEIICTYRIGVHSMSFEKLVSDVSTLMQDEGKRAELGKNARKYVIENHSPKRVAEAYNNVLMRLPIKRRALRS